MLTEQENIYLHELMKTEDANEGVKAFLEKRKRCLAPSVKNEEFCAFARVVFC